MILRLGVFAASILLLGGLASFAGCGEAPNHQTGPCTANCDGRLCGSDGCGGVCGLCEDNQTCTVAGQCIAGSCIADCSLAECGDDGCGGSCGACQDPNPLCSPDRRCVNCLPDCTGRTCGDDGCGGSCGGCDPGFACDGNGLCCSPFCEGRMCGDDGCGGSCGTCTGTTACADGICQ